MTAKVRKRSYTAPIPADAKIITIKSKPHARYSHNGKQVTAPLTASRTRIRLLSRNYYGEFRDPSGRLHIVKLFTDELASQAELFRLIQRAEREEVGIADPFEAHRKRPLIGHLDDFRQYLLAKGNTENYAEKTHTRIKALLDGCGFDRMAEISASSVVEWLASQRQLGSMGIKTSNYYLRDVKSFCRWLVKDRRAKDSPLAHLSAMNAAVEEGRQRRAMSQDQFGALVRSALGGPVLQGLPGPDRGMLYLVGAGTGFRASELASLTPQSFDLDADPATVTVEASYSKRRRRDTQPIRADLAQSLRGFLQGRKASEPVWPGYWPDQAAKMVKADLEASGLEYVDADGRVFDFHGLRHQFISNLAAAGVHPKTAQTLARHSTITLTMDRYTHLGNGDQSAAIAKLPPMPVSVVGVTPYRENFACCSACCSDEQNANTLIHHEPQAISLRQALGELETAEKAAFIAGCGTLARNGNAIRPRGGMADTGDLKSPCRCSQPHDTSTGYGEHDFQLVALLVKNGRFDPDLRKLIAAWPSLPPGTRRAILDLISQAEPQTLSQSPTQSPQSPQSPSPQSPSPTTE